MRDRNGKMLNPGDEVFICRNLKYGHVSGFRFGNSDRPDQVILNLGESMPGVPVLHAIEPWEVEKFLIQEKVEQCK